MKACSEFGVRAMPVTAAIDSKDTSVHQPGAAEW